jgi:uncharacterized protein (DUF58 family)
MIVPRTKLLLWVAAVGLPAALLAAAEPSAAAIAIAAVGGLGLVTLFDALRSQSGIAGISLEFPPVCRMTKDRAAQLELRIRNRRMEPALVRVAPSLPRALRSSHDELWVSLPGGSEWSLCPWPCVGMRRGRYQVRSANLETTSRLGFWGRRATVPLDSEIRIYPNLLTERGDLSALFLNRGSFGVHAQRQVGKGREFEKLREYVPGDDYSEIHWKATARRGRPITKVFQVERTQEVYVLIDASRLSARGTEGANHREPTTVLERFVTAALVLGVAAEKQGDLFGLITFSRKVETCVRAGNGRAHYNACRDAIFSLEPRVVAPDFDELFTFIRQRLRRRSLLLFLTALDDPSLAEDFLRKVELVSRQHLVVVNMLQPPGVGPLFDGVEPVSLNEIYQRLGGQLLWNHLQELQRTLQLRGVGFHLLQHERLSAELVSQYVAIKRRQML